MIKRDLNHCNRSIAYDYLESVHDIITYDILTTHIRCEMLVDKW